MPLSWDFIECWFALFGGADQRQPEQGRNRRLGPKPPKASGRVAHGPAAKWTVVADLVR
jgi:hypothetical protein